MLTAGCVRSEAAFIMTSRPDLVGSEGGARGRRLVAAGLRRLRIVPAVYGHGPEKAEDIAGRVRSRAWTSSINDASLAEKWPRIHSDERGGLEKAEHKMHNT